VAPVAGARTLELTASVRAAWSDASRGDLRPAPGPRGDASDGAPLTAFAAQAAASSGDGLDAVWWLEQVHGAVVLDVPPGPVAARPGAGPVLRRGAEPGDALVTDRPGVALCVLTADCGSLALASPEGVCAAVHAGWRGLVAGVVERTVARMRDHGATDVVAALGPCIHAGCYEFSPDDLDEAAAVYGDTVRGTTSAGRPALDVPAGIAAALVRAGATGADGVDACTACGDGYFSHRARADTGRQALVVWRSGVPAP
jgi:polyphenol oxidase